MPRLRIFLVTLAICASALPYQAKGAVSGMRLCDLLLLWPNPALESANVIYYRQDSDVDTEASRARCIDFSLRQVQYLNSLRPYFFIPSELTMNFAEEGSLLNAYCIPLENSVHIPWQSFAEPAHHVSGVTGHEIGHLLFTVNMQRLLRPMVSRLMEIRSNGVTMGEIADSLLNIWTDAKWVKEEKARLERSFPELTNLARNPFPDIAPQAIAKYQMLKEMELAQKKTGQQRSFRQDEIIEHLIFHEMAGFQEVFADLNAAIMTRDRLIMTKVLPGKLSQALRSFGESNDVAAALDQLDNLTRLSEEAYKLIPHLTLYMLRDQIYQGYYRAIGREIGADATYDVLVLRNVLETMGHVYVAAALRPKKPNVRLAESFLTLTREMEKAIAVEAVAVVERWDEVIRGQSALGRTRAQSFSRPTMSQSNPARATRERNRAEEQTVEMGAGAGQVMRAGGR